MDIEEVQTIYGTIEPQKLQPERARPHTKREKQENNVVFDIGERDSYLGKLSKNKARRREKAKKIQKAAEAEAKRQSRAEQRRTRKRQMDLIPEPVDLTKVNIQ